MVWLILILGIIIYFIYSVFKNKQEILQKRASKLGNMKQRYRILIDKFLEIQNAKIISSTSDNIKIYANQDSLSINISVLEMYDKVIINFRSFIGSYERLKKIWQLPLGFDQNLFLNKIEKELQNTGHGNLFLVCPFLGNEYYSSSVRVIDLTTNQKSIGVVDVSYFQPRINELKIDCYEEGNGITIPWTFIRKDCETYFFKDNHSNIWSLNKIEFVFTIFSENKQVIYKIVE